LKETGRYCKAYLVQDLREFPEWDALAARKPAAESSGLTPSGWGDTDYLFLQEDYTVTDGLFLNENVVFDHVTDSWRTFCERQLGFPGSLEAMVGSTAVPGN
jgi:hypothetical protein